jgi:hypothetical protein
MEEGQTVVDVSQDLQHIRRIALPSWDLVPKCSYRFALKKLNKLCTQQVNELDYNQEP